MQRASLPSSLVLDMGEALDSKSENIDRILQQSTEHNVALLMHKICGKIYS